MPNTPITRISVGELAYDDWAVVVYHRLKISEINLSDRRAANRVAGELARALRLERVPMAPVVQLSPATELQGMLEVETELMVDAWWDDRELDSGIPRLVESLRSVAVVNASEPVDLDFDQALSLSDILMSALSTAEDVGDEDQRNHIYNWMRELEKVGIPVVPLLPEGYEIRLLEHQNAWAVIYQGESLGAWANADHAWTIIRNHIYKEQNA